MTALVKALFGFVSLTQVARHSRPEIIPDLHRDPVKIDPEHYKIDFENEKVRVVRISLRSEEKSLQHEDPEGIMVCPKECHIRFTRGNGKVQDVHLAAGESRWVYDDSRFESNLALSLSSSYT